MNRIHFVTCISIAVWLPVATSYMCQESEPHCFTSLNIDYAYTMVSSLYGPLTAIDRKLYYRDEITNTLIQLPPEEPVTSADGFEKPRRLIAANGTMPGPTIVVYVNQKLTVIVKNNLFGEQVTIHWHGIEQKGSPFMDGVGMVTQCPIAPGQTFNYTFQPTIGGTYWYHSHVGDQRDNGLYGAFIVLRSEQSQDDVGHVLMLGDWNHNYDHLTVLTANIDKQDKIPHSILINGKGHFNNEAPLETIHVSTQAGRIRFRIIAVGSGKAFLFHITNVDLELIEIDGFKVKPTIVNQIIINPAERYDFFLRIQESGLFNISVIRLDGTGLTETNVAGLGFLHVNGETNVSAPLTASGNIKILNCPIPFLSYRPNAECIPVTDLKALYDEPVDNNTKHSFEGMRKKQTFFLNFGTPYSAQSINGRRFKWPTVSAISQPNDIETCNDNDCTNGCHCSNSLQLYKEANVTMILLNLGNGSVISHPVHMHGHKFKVLKMGLPTVDAETGKIVANEDIVCSHSVPNNESVCSSAKWRDPSWYEHIPGANLENPIKRDTIVVPYGGYVIIRFNADNPGVWLMHCHNDKHMIRGMTLMLNESFEDFNLGGYTVPKSFPKCFSFHNKEWFSPELDQNEQILINKETNIPAIVLGTSLGVFTLIVIVGHIQRFARRRRIQNIPAVEPTVFNNHITIGQNGLAANYKSSEND